MTSSILSHYGQLVNFPAERDTWKLMARIENMVSNLVSTPNYLMQPPLVNGKINEVVINI